MSGASATFAATSHTQLFSGNPSKPRVCVPFRPITTATRLSTLCRFLQARRSLAACSLEPTPEGRRRYFQPTDATQTSLYLSAPVLSSLDRFAGVASGSFEKLACSRRRACFGGTARSIRRVIRSTTSFAIFASDVSVVIPLRALRPRSRTNPGLNHRGHLHQRAVTQRRFPWPRDAFGRSRFERRFLLGRSRAPCGGGSSRISATAEDYASLVRRRSLFANVGSRSILVRARYSHEASPCPRPTWLALQRAFA